MRSVSQVAAVATVVIASALAAPPAIGPYNVSSTQYKVPALDGTDAQAWLIYPVNFTDATLRFPLIAYLHGFLGGDIDLLGYTELFAQMASYGFVIAAPFSCDVGCNDTSRGAPWSDCAGLPSVSPGPEWAPWYAEVLKTIDWARNETAAGTDPNFALIDWSVGVGIAGHSMGGQATTIAASAACTAKWNIRSAVLHHPFDGTVPGGNLGSNISVPTAGFASTGDDIWPMTQAIMNVSNARPTAYRNEVGWSHLEPVLVPPIENPLLATYTAAWFKVTLNGDSGTYHDLIFGSGPDSMCKHANMSGCYATQ